jgi:anti-sigma regulatory factor (Ser/Thr protein kinase)
LTSRGGRRPPFRLKPARRSAEFWENMDPSAPTLRVELTTIVADQMVSVLRQFVETALAKLGISESRAVDVAMAAHELLENVAKYSDNRDGQLLLEVQPLDERARLMLTVSNRAAPANIGRLKEVIEELNATTDPFSYYLSLIQKETPEGESGVGLARIRAEAKMSLTLTIDDQQVRVSATSTSLSLDESVPA